MTNNRHLGRRLDDLARALGSYYSIGFRPRNPGDGKIHNLRVRVREEGLRLHYRHEYSARAERDGLADRTFAAAALGVTSNPLEIEVEVRDQEPGEGRKFLVPIMVKVPLASLSLLPRSAEHEGEISLLVAVRDRNGLVSEVQRRRYPVKISHQRFFTALDEHAEFLLNLVMGEGQQRVAVGVRDELGQVETAVAVDLEVGRADG